MKALRVPILLLFLAGSVLCSSGSAQSYTALFLGQGHHIFVAGLNNSGMSVGHSGIAHSAALLWSSTGALTNLGTLGGKDAEALAINNLGVVVGDSSEAGQLGGHAFLWTSTGGMQDLLGPNSPLSVATAINDSSEVVGNYAFSNSFIHAFLWTKTGGMQDLGTLGGHSYAAGINSAGHVVGASQLPDGSTQAFLWTAQDGMKQIDLGGTSGSQATAINDLDQIVGSYVNPQDNHTHAFLLDPSTGLRDLGLWRGIGSSYAFAVNNSGDVVGISLYPAKSGRTGTASVLWKNGGGVQKLGQLVVPKLGLPRGATGINASGQISANGPGSYILTPH